MSIFPTRTGIRYVQELRAEGVTLPILMLTALGTTEDKLNGFDVGADDYMLKPFEFRELLARIRALLKRSHSGMQDRRPHTGSRSGDQPQRHERETGRAEHRAHA